MAILEGKKAIIIGDRDGIPGPAIAECVKTAGAEGDPFHYLWRCLCPCQILSYCLFLYFLLL